MIRSTALPRAARLWLGLLAALAGRSLASFRRAVASSRGSDPDSGAAGAACPSRLRPPPFTPARAAAEDRPRAIVA